MPSAILASANLFAHIAEDFLPKNIQIIKVSAYCYPLDFRFSAILHVLSRNAIPAIILLGKTLKSS